MIEFNPDGSIKLPSAIQKNRDKNEHRMKRAMCIRVKKEVVSATAPKKCCLHIKLSDKIVDPGFIDKHHKFFKLKSETPTKLIKKSYNEFEIEIGTDFKRCSDCNRLIAQLRNALDGNLILDEGSCSQKKRQFSYEDYFD